MFIMVHGKRSTSKKIRKDEELKSWTMGIRIIHLPKWIPMKQRRSWTMTMPHSRVLTMAPLKSVGNLTCRGYHTFPQVAVGPLVGMSNGIPRGAFHTIHRHKHMDMGCLEYKYRKAVLLSPPHPQMLMLSLGCTLGCGGQTNQTLNAEGSYIDFRSTLKFWVCGFTW